MDRQDRLPARTDIFQLAVPGIGSTRGAVYARDGLRDSRIQLQPGVPGVHGAQRIDMAPYVGARRLNENVLFKAPSPSHECSHHQKEHDKTRDDVKDYHKICFFGWYKYNKL